jgi:hypothetical protein
MMVIQPFARRTRYDGIDSICTTCYRTIARSDDLQELAQQETLHICAGWDLAYLLSPKAPPQSTN